MIKKDMRHLAREQKALALFPDTEYLSESALLADVIEFIEMTPHAKVIRQNASVRSGISDLLICYYGQFIAVELKDCTGEPSAPQENFIHDIQGADGIAGVARNVKEVYRLMIAAYDRQRGSNP